MDPDELLLESIKKGDIRLAEVLLRGGANATTVITDATALHIAAGKEDPALAALILDHGGDPNSMPSEDALTPLQVACAFNQCENVELLLNAGGNPLLKDSDGYDCLQFAEEYGCGKCMALIKLAISRDFSPSKSIRLNKKTQSEPSHQDRRKPRHSVYMANFQDNLESFNNVTQQLDVTSPDHPVVVSRTLNQTPSFHNRRSLFEDTVCLDRSPDSPSSSNNSFHTADGSDNSINTSHELSPSHAAAECDPQSKQEQTKSKYSTDSNSGHNDSQTRIPTSILSKTNKSVPSKDAGDVVQTKRNQVALDESVCKRFNCTRLSEFHDIAGGPLHSTVCDFHDQPVPLSVTAMLDDLHLDTNSTLNLSLDSNMKDQLTINTHPSQSDCCLGNEEKKKVNETVTLPRKYYNHALDSPSKNAAFSISPEKEKCHVSPKRTADTANMLGKTVLNETYTKSEPQNPAAQQFGASFFTDDESTILTGPNYRHKIEVPQNHHSLSLGETIPLLDTKHKSRPRHEESILASGDGSRLFKHKSPDADHVIHPDFFASPVTSTRIATPDVSLDLCAGDYERNAAWPNVSFCRGRDASKGSRRTKEAEDLYAQELRKSVKEKKNERSVYVGSKPSDDKRRKQSSQSLRTETKSSPAKTANKENIPIQTQSCSIQKTSELDSVTQRLWNVSGCSVESAKSSTSSKDSTCSCHSGAEKRVIEDEELNLMEIMLAKDALDCSLHFGKADESTESTCIYDWRSVDTQSTSPRKALFKNIQNHQKIIESPGEKNEQVAVNSPNVIKKYSTRSHSDSGAYSQSSSSAPSCSETDPQTTLTEENPVSSPILVDTEIRNLTNKELRQELVCRGDTPGPITVNTRSTYEIRLARIKSDPNLVNFKKDKDAFCPELRRALEGRLCLDETSDSQLNSSLCRLFVNPSPQRQWREGTEKKSFNYLLLDPRVTQNLPARHKHLSESESFETFVKAIFYVGKGKRSRPYQHFKEAMAFISGKSDKASEKVLTILRIWEAGLGVISLHIFQNVLPTEAYTREACMIDALGLHRLTNKQPGQVYCNVQNWGAKKRRMAGVLLLKKAYNIYLHEGERQLRAYDIKSEATEYEKMNMQIGVPVVSGQYMENSSSLQSS